MKKRKNNRKRRKKSGNMFFSASKPGGMRSSASKSRSRKRNRKGYRKLSSIFSNLNFFSKSGASSNNNKRNNKKYKNKAEKIKYILGRVALYGATFGLFVGIIGVIVIGLYLRNIEESLPDGNELLTWDLEETTIIYDRNGNELNRVYEQDSQNRVFVEIDDYQDHTKWALLSAEDEDFYQHQGLDWRGIIRCGLRAAENYITKGDIGNPCGASTVTQQLIKNTILPKVFGPEAATERTIKRKVRELLLAIQIEKSMSKDEILQLYMNEVPLGGVVYGYGAAAKTYFDKDIEDLTLRESAFLAGIVQAPSRGSDPDYYEGRIEYVLNQMENNSNKTGVDSDSVDEAKEQELAFASPEIDIPAYHYVFYIRDLLEQEYGADVVRTGGLRVYTSIDMSAQRVLEEEIQEGIPELGGQYGVKNGAGVIVDPNTGHLLAMVGSVDVNSEDPKIDGKVNITTSLRQQGSSFKPYVYLTAFQKYGPWMETADIKYDFGNYEPTNWDDRFMGPMTAREALVKSRNLPANYTLQAVGTNDVLNNVERLGITTLSPDQPYGLSMALGSAEMKLIEHTYAYSVFANEGVKMDPTAILRVEDSRGEVIYEWEENEGERVLDEKDAYMLNWTLCDLGQFRDQPQYGNYTIDGKRAICGKTGTTNGPKDLVSMQYHKNLVVSVWGGNNDGTIVPNAWSTTVPLPIANRVMTRLADSYKPELYTQPPGIQSGTVCDLTGRQPAEDTECQRVSTIWAGDREPPEQDLQKYKVCKDSGKVSTNEEVAERFDLLKEVGVFDLNLENKEQEELYIEYLNESDDLNVVFEKPEEEDCKLPLGDGNSPIVNFESPNQGEAFDAGQRITLRANAAAEGDTTEVTYFLNGEPLNDSPLTEFPYEYQFNLDSSLLTGNYNITAEVTDDRDRNGSSSISIRVNNDSQSISVGLIQGQVIGIDELPFEVPVTFDEPEGSSDARVIVRVRGVDSTYSRDFSTSKQEDGTWLARVSDSNLVPGSYTVQAVVTSNGNIITSDGVSITIDEAQEEEPVPGEETEDPANGGNGTGNNQ